MSISKFEGRLLTALCVSYVFTCSNQCGLMTIYGKSRDRCMHANKNDSDDYYSCTNVCMKNIHQSYC
jgi:hypothetical protein